jgi:hypothetical protein
LPLEALGQEAGLLADPSNDKVELVHDLLGRSSTERDPSLENLAF